MARHGLIDQLPDPFEKRVALMAVSGQPHHVIAYMLETSTNEISVILKRPHVANFVLKLTALYADDIAPAISNVADAINSHAERAFHVEKEAMERLFNVDDPEHKHFVRAQLAAATTAQDILDRAGHRAPTKIESRNEISIAPESLEHLGRIVKDVDALNVTPEKKIA